MERLNFELLLVADSRRETLLPPVSLENNARYVGVEYNDTWSTDMRPSLTVIEGRGPFGFHAAQVWFRAGPHFSYITFRGNVDENAKLEANIHVDGALKTHLTEDRQREIMDNTLTVRSHDYKGETFSKGGRKYKVNRAWVMYATVLLLMGVYRQWRTERKRKVKVGEDWWQVAQDDAKTIVAAFARER